MNNKAAKAVLKAMWQMTGERFTKFKHFQNRVFGLVRGLIIDSKGNVYE